MINQSTKTKAKPPQAHFDLLGHLRSLSLGSPGGTELAGGVVVGVATGGLAEGLWGVRVVVLYDDRWVKVGRGVDVGLWGCACQSR